MGNYWLISLTCILCIITEALVGETIIKHKENKLFSKYQYGFIDRQSTNLQLLFVLDERTEIRYQGGAIVCRFHESICQAHKRLMHKPDAYGFGGPVHDWVRSFLTERIQRVKVHFATSGWRKVTSEIPQGSVLSPILFVLYINHIPEALENNSVTAMFMDDTKLCRRTDPPNRIKYIQEDLGHIFQWSDIWLMKFQPN